MNYLYKFAISSVILIVSLLIAIHYNTFPEQYKIMHSFIIAFLCGYSINEVYRIHDNKEENEATSN